MEDYFNVRKEMHDTLFYESKLENYLHCIILFSLKKKVCIGIEKSRGTFTNMLTVVISGW